MTEMQFSVIVPVYNAERTLDECVGSVLGAASRDFELILVNDGSRDNSAAMCDAFAARDARVAVIHQENQGLACARNAGIRAARGDYLVHLDCDDFLLEGWFARMTSELHVCPEAEALVWRIMLCRNGSLIPDQIHFPADTKPLLTGHEAFRLLFCSNLGTPWQTFRYVVRRSCLVERNLFYRPGVLHEDIDFNPYMILQLQSIHCCSTPYYAYRKGREGSITAALSVPRCLDVMAVTRRWAETLKTCDLDGDAVFRFHSVLARQLWDVVAAIPGFPAADRAPLYRALREQTWLLERIRQPRLSALGKRSLLALFGPVAASWILAWRRRLYAFRLL